MPDVAEETPPQQGTDTETIPSMSFLEHLEELRKRIIYSLLYIAGGFSVAYWFRIEMFELMQRPIMAALQSRGLDDQLVYLNPTEPFNMYLKVALMAGLFISSPLVLYQVWMFISPGLYRHEKRYLLPFLFATVGLFVAGGYFGYRIVYPAALDFLIGYGEQFQPMITIGEYVDLFLTVIIGLGIVFEMPVLIFFLALMRVVNARFLWSNFRYAILGIFVVAAILTPTTDILNMMMFAAPMMTLYLVSIGIAWMVNPGKKKAA